MAQNPVMRDEMPEIAEPEGRSGGRVYVGREEELTEGARRLVEVGGEPVGVFRVLGDLVAYSGRCLHSGGPVCQGQIFPRTEAVIDDQGRVLTERSCPDRPQLVCPWHGWEYDLRDGSVVGSRNLRLSSYEVEVEDGVVYVRDR
jgi:nitrite reductase/ring-hydroxylating ferredoxin subunit